MKLRIAIGFVLMCGCAFGAFQFELANVGGWSSSRPYGSPWAITITEGSGKLYVGDPASYWRSFTRQVDAAAGGNFGTIDVATGALATSSATALTLDNGLTVYEVGEFSAGDTVGFWVRNRTGDIGVSLGESSDPDFNYRAAYGKTQGTLQFTGAADSWLANNGVATMYFYGVESAAPKGQPLPGVLATLAAGAVVLGFKRRKRACA